MPPDPFNDGEQYSVVRARINEGWADLGDLEALAYGSDSLISASHGVTLSDAVHSALHRQRVVLLRHATDPAQPVEISVPNGLTRTFTFMRASDQVGECRFVRAAGATCTLNGAVAVTLDVDRAILEVVATNQYRVTALASEPGDMRSSIYDKQGVRDDAFSMQNMIETETAKVMSSAERNRVARAHIGYSGTLTLSSGRADVLFGIDEPDANYQVMLTGEVAGETFAVPDETKTTGSFRIESSSVNSTAKVHWALVRGPTTLEWTPDLLTSVPLAGKFAADGDGILRAGTAGTVLQGNLIEIYDTLKAAHPSDAIVVQQLTNSGTMGLLTQATAANQPEYIRDAVGGHPAMHFDGNRQLVAAENMSARFLDTKADATVLILVRPALTENPSVSWNIAVTHGGSPSHTGWSLGYWNQGTVVDAVRVVVANASGTFALDHRANNYLPDLQWSPLVYRFSGTTGISLLKSNDNPAVTATYTGNISQAATAIPFTLGGTIFQGRIMEIWLWSGAVTDAEVDKLLIYGRRKVAP